MDDTLWTFLEAGEATGGRAAFPFMAMGASIDTRSLKPDDLFFALPGEKADGHDYVAMALEKDAAACVVTRIPAGVKDSAPLLVVKDVLAAMQDMARYRRNQSGARIVGVTGSVGKTSVKEGIAHILADQGSTHATSGNFNNHIGLPLTLCRMPRECRFAVLEMGMNHAGEIEPLSKIARPDVAVITTIEAVHLEFFEGIEGIADAKAEIFAGMKEGTTAVLNRDNGMFDRLSAAAKKKGFKIRSFGTKDADAVLVKRIDTPSGQKVEATLDGKAISFDLGLSGAHQALNSLAMLLAIQAAGADVPRAMQSLGTLSPAYGRGQKKDLPHANPHINVPFTLIDDSYNASPASMKAAYAVLAETGRAQSARTVAVLGNMLELGPDSENLHRSLAQELVAKGINKVFTAGAFMRHLFDALPPEMQGGHAEDWQALLATLNGRINAGDVVLVKGSHGSGMWRLASSLSDASATAKAG